MFEMPAFCNRDFCSSTLSVNTSFSIRTDDSPPLMMLLTVCISAHLVFTVLEQAAVVPRSHLQSSKDALWLMLLPTPQHTWCRPTYDMAVQGAATECLNTLQLIQDGHIVLGCQWWVGLM
ncbi:hypothetical protein EMCRGX_G009894 [Ephydatia muelleri]